MSDARYRVWLLESKSPHWIGGNYAIQPEEVTADALRLHIRAQGGEPTDLRITLVGDELFDLGGAHRRAFNLAAEHRRLVTPLWPSAESSSTYSWQPWSSPLI